MNFRSLNVTIKPRHIFPWVKQMVQVDGQDMFYVRRSFRILSVITDVRNVYSQDLHVRVSQPNMQKPEFEIQTPHRTYQIRKISYWQWECSCKQEVMMINRLGGIKCVLSQQGRQLAMMSLSTNLPFGRDRNTYIRVNSEKYLHVSIAAALILKSHGVNLYPLFLNSSKLNPIRTVELAR